MKRIVTAGLLVLVLLVPGRRALAQVAEGKNDVFTDLFLLTAKPTDGAGERETSFNWTTSYARFLTDRLGAGPIFRIVKDPHQGANGYVGGLVRYHFGAADAQIIPFVEFNASHSFGNESDSPDMQIMGGLVIPMGRTGGRFRIAPYYYRQFLDEGETGEKWFRSWGVTFGAGLLF
jgi:hypothetical protein